MTKNILVIAPHPDDEVLGCGGSIAKHTQNSNNVYVLIVTRGSKRFYSDESVVNIRKEALLAHNKLGVRNTYFFDFPAPELDIISLADISSEIFKVIKTNNIGILYLPYRGDIHHDHKIVFQAGLVAARPVDNYCVKEIYCYETLSETEWAPPFANDTFLPNRFVNITEQFEAKREALLCFKSQLKKFPNPRSIEAIEALAKFRGATVGFQRAEAFMVIRQIKN